VLDDLFIPSHLLIIVLLLVVFFGGKRLPDAARGLGRSLRIFKAEMSGLHGDSQQPAAQPQPPAPQPTVAQPPTEPGSPA